MMVAWRQKPLTAAQAKDQAFLGQFVRTDKAYGQPQFQIDADSEEGKLKELVCTSTPPIARDTIHVDLISQSLLAINSN